ncbi:MAG: Kdo hydroxylase family protein [Abitibacteriaceae bacterium]|nr:Kdo hydroxylase family protein [Abditibacteriaceae bacterium]
MATAENSQHGASWVSVDDYQYPQGWLEPAQSDQRTRWCCEQLEEGGILYFKGIPFDFPDADREFLLSQKQSESNLHKNISYRPKQDVIRGLKSVSPEEMQRLQAIMRNYSAQVTQFLAQVLKPYAPHWSLDFASFRPEEEEGRDLSVHKRNDLLHVDAFPTRPTRGGRILRVFTNINPQHPRVWLTTDRFEALAKQYAEDAGLKKFAAQSFTPGKTSGGPLAAIKRAVGMKTPDHTPYDHFMLHFHDYLKENSDFQQNTPKIRTDFPPLSTWMVFTDSVPHAVLSGQYALEQTFIIPVRALIHPEKSPIGVLENLTGKPLGEGPLSQKAA